METNRSKTEKTFEKPVILILIAICLVAGGLIIEAFINNSHAQEQKINIYELNNTK